MNFVKKHFGVLIAGLFIIVNLVIFGAMNSHPILWTNDEIMWHGFFWSMNGMDDYHLHTGFRGIDFLKPFVPFYVDGDLRFRQVSYFFEMLSFKFWQMFGEVYMRNWSLVIYHLINVTLVWKLVNKISDCRRSAWIASLFCLNAGIAMATMMYPFRNAKMLVVVWLLLAWLISIPHKKKFIELSHKNWLLFWGLFFIAGFTDEMILFLFPMIFAFAGLRDGYKQFLSKRFVISVVVFACLYGATIFLVTKICQWVSPVWVPANAQTTFLSTMMTYFTGGQMWHDLFVAYTKYFIPMCFGYWDETMWGKVALGATIVLAVIVISRRPQGLAAKTAIMILGMIMVKSILLPHNAGYHPTIMPEGTIFPSLLFFGWYYVYPEIIMVSLVMGLLFKNAVQKTIFYVLALTMITLVNGSNFYHNQNGPMTILSFMHFDVPERQEILKDVLRLDDELQEHATLKTSVSFPSGDTSVVKARRHEPTRSMYERIVPVRFLKQLEEGKMRLAYENVPHPGVSDVNAVLSTADYFYDMYTDESYDLKKIRERYSVEDLPYSTIASPRGAQQNIRVTPQDHEIVFFIRGRAMFLLSNASHQEQGEQNYGFSFQMFRFPVADFMTQDGKVNFKILTTNKSECVLVGPFVM